METSRDDLVEEIVTHLGRPYGADVRDKVNAHIDRHLQNCARLLPFPDVNTIGKFARGLDDAVASFPDDMPIPVEGMTVRELRSALHWLQHIEGPSRDIDQEKILAAHAAASLSKELSKLDRGRYEAIQSIAGLFYKASSGQRPLNMKRAVDHVIRWRKPELSY